MSTTAFKVISYPLLGNLEIHVGRNLAGFFYEILDLNRQQIVDVKDNLTEGLFFEAVDCALNPSSKPELLTLIHSL